MKRLLVAFICFASPCHAELVWQSGCSTATYTQQQAIAYCDSLQTDDATDWRLPTRAELLTLVDYTRYMPASSQTMQIDHPYWSSTDQAYNEGNGGWVVYFYYGTVHHALKSTPGYARCVRDEGTDTTPEYTDNDDGTVTDDNNHLMWLKSANVLNDYRGAAMFCFFCRIGGFSDWRIPTIQELLTTVDELKWCETSLDPLEGVWGRQWSSTPYAVRTADYLPHKVEYEEPKQWIVTNSGCTGGADKTNYPYTYLGDPGLANYVRCVRSMAYEAPSVPDYPSVPAPTPYKYLKPKPVVPDYSAWRERRR